MLALIAAFAWRGTAGKSNTFDELVHVTAGHAYWSRNDYRLQPENGNLPQRIAALPFQFADWAPAIDTDTDLWSQSKQWRIAQRWWFKSGADHRLILKWSRAAMLAFNMVGMAVLFLISGRLWGRAGGYASLLLAGFCPNFLGHLPLATSDFAGAWTLILAVVTYSALLERVTAARVAAAGAAAGLALLCKHSALILAPVAAVLGLWRMAEARALPFGWFRAAGATANPCRRAVLLGGASVLAALLAAGVVWTAYGWRFAAANPAAGAFQSFLVPWETFKEEGRLHSVLISHLQAWRVLPEALLYGVDYVLSMGNRAAFLNGAAYLGGNPVYFVWCFLYKTPLPALPIHILGWTGFIGWMLRHRLEVPAAAKGLMVLSALYAANLAASDMNIGYRHAFPVLYVSCIVAGVLFGRGLGLADGVRLVLAACLLSLVPLAWVNSDRTISYMNVIGGGADGGYQRLRDSSLDWGQDLPAAAAVIRAAQRAEPDKPVYLGYFGSADPAAFGIGHVRLLPVFNALGRAELVGPLEAGLYVISATSLRDAAAWDIGRELAYRKLREDSRLVYARLQADGAANPPLSQTERELLLAFEKVRFLRLAHYLNGRAPDRIIHGSILVFDLRPDEIGDFR